jgi:exo-beta-1,3-glucanase (GH17 family)
MLPSQNLQSGAACHSAKTRLDSKALLLVLLLALPAMLMAGGSEQARNAALSNGTGAAATESIALRPLDPGLQALEPAAAYGCFRKGQWPGGPAPSREELRQDLHFMNEHWRFLRIYNADELSEAMLQIIAEDKLELKLLLGIWLEPESEDGAGRQANLRNINAAIEQANAWPEIVSLLLVGNETQVFWSGHQSPVDSVIAYVRHVRSAVRQPVSTADDWMYWALEESRLLAAELDVITTHLHPLWNGQSLEASSVWMDERLAELKKIHGSLPLLIGETGWATDMDSTLVGEGQQGSLLKAAADEASQLQFLHKMEEWSSSAAVPVVWFEVFDESWKGGGDTSSRRHVEKHWGLMNEDRSPKSSFNEWLRLKAQAAPAQH